MKTTGTERGRPGAFARGPAIALAALAVGGALVYGLLALAPNRAAFDAADHATGGLAKLEAMRDAPPRPDAALKAALGPRAPAGGLEGRVVVLNLWATWCAPCVTEMPTLAALQRARPQGLVVVPVSVDRAADAAKAGARLAELSGGILPFAHDPTMAATFAVRARGFPTTIVYDRNGRERARLAGEADWSSPEALALIDAVARIEP